MKKQVKCIKGHPDPNVLETGKTYRVAVIVDSGWDYRGYISKQGYILVNSACGYPYVWDTDRFEDA